MHNPTPEQEAIITAAQAGANLVVQAGAGTGKTSTLKMVARALGDTKGLYIAYNRAIADEARASFPDTIQCKTAHSLAFTAVGHEFRHRLNGPRQPARRTAELLNMKTWLELSTKVAPARQARIALDAVAQFCYSADETLEAHHVPRQRGMTPDDHQALVHAVLPHARRAWDDIRDRDGRLRFEHDHYLKIWALARPKLPFDLVMLDECQDSNPLVAQLVQDQAHTQQIAVGDSAQQLYAWRGAVDALSTWPADRRLYLSQSWRFGRAVADEANKWLGLLDTPLRLSGNDALASRLCELPSPEAILCRTNAEAMAQVLTHLGAGSQVSLVGGGAALKRLAEAADDLKNGKRTSHPELWVFNNWAELQEYVEDEPAGRDLKPFVDLINSHGSEAVIAAVDKLTDEKRADVIVSTAHKAKGREWDSVRIATDFPEPERDEDGEWENVSAADVMLAYVAVTRAKLRLDRGGLAWIDGYLR